MRDLEKRLPAECDALPNPIVQDVDKIYKHIINGEPTPIVWQGETGSPFRLEVVASIAPEAKRTTYGHTKIDKLAPRLRLESQFQVPLGLGSTHFEQLRATYLHTLDQDEAIKRLVESRFTNNKKTTMQLNPLGEKQFSVVTNAPYSKVGPYVVKMSNDRDLSGGYAPNKAPHVNEDNVRQIISTYLGLTWLIGSVLGDPRVPQAALLDRYAKGSDSFYRKTGGGRPRASTAYSSEPTYIERVASNAAVAKLKEEYSPPAGITPLPLNEEYAYSLDPDELDQINVRVDAINEPERARQWGIANLGGLLIAGEKGSGKSTLAFSIADQADAPLFFWPSDVVHVGNSSRTAEKIAGLRDVIKTATNSNNTLGIVFESLQLFKSASPVEIEEISRLVHQAVENPKILLIGTMTNEGGAFATPKGDIKEIGLFGHGLFNTIIDMEITEKTMGAAITRLMNDDIVHGKRMFEELTHEKLDVLLQNTYGVYTISELEDAIETCKSRKFLEQRRLKGQHPGPITVHNIYKALKDNDTAKDKAHRPTGDNTLEN